MCNARINLLFTVWMRVFVKRNTDQSVRWDVIVKPIFDLVDKLRPVPIVSAQNLSLCIVLILLRKPYKLIPGLPNVLRGLNEVNNISAFPFVVGVFNEGFPRLVLLKL